VCNDKKWFSWSDIETVRHAFKPGDTRRVFKKGAKNLRPSAFLGLAGKHALGPTFCCGDLLSQHDPTFYGALCFSKLKICIKTQIFSFEKHRASQKVGAGMVHFGTFDQKVLCKGRSKGGVLTKKY